jgi:hypothetical protein
MADSRFRSGWRQEGEGSIDTRKINCPEVRSGPTGGRHISPKRPGPKTPFTVFVENFRPSVSNAGVELWSSSQPPEEKIVGSNLDRVRGFRSLYNALLCYLIILIFCFLYIETDLAFTIRVQIHKCPNWS